MLLLFTSERKRKNPTFILASYGSVFTSERKSKHPTFILASYGDVFTSVRKSKHPAFILASYGAVFTSERKRKHPPYILASLGAECYCYSFSNVKANIRHLFQHLTEPNITVIHVQCYRQTSDKNCIIWSQILPPLFCRQLSTSR